MRQITLKVPSVRERGEREGRIASRACLSAMIIVIGGLAGCAGEPPPSAQMAVARAAVDEAQRNGAAERAPQNFAASQDKLARAQAAMAGGNNTDARRLAEEATADAQLATTESRTAVANAILNRATTGSSTPQ